MYHEVVPSKIIFSYGLVLKICILKVFEPFIRCKWNIDQEKWPCIKKWMCWLFLIQIHIQKGQFQGGSSFFMFSLLPYSFPYFVVTTVTFGLYMCVGVCVWISLPQSLDICNQRTSFASLTGKYVGPWQWRM